MVPQNIMNVKIKFSLQFQTNHTKMLQKRIWSEILYLI